MPADTLPAPVTEAVSAPAAAPASSPSIPSPTSRSAAPEANDFDKTFDDLKEAPAAAPTTPPAAPEPKPGEQTAPKPAEAPAATARPAKREDDEFSPPESGTLRDVRDAARRFGKMAKTATARNQELEAKLKEAEARTPEVPPDVAKIQADYQRLVKENQEHRERLTRADYANSPDYEQKYKAPYHQAYMRGRTAVAGIRDADGTVIGGLKVRIVNPETEEVTYRPGTSEDFDKLYGMTDSDADEAAEKMFGPSARRVIALRDTAKERAEMAYAAIKENTAKYAETKQAEEARSSSQKLALRGLWKKVNDDLQTKHAEWFGEREDDKEWNEALAKGTAIAQQRFGEQYLQLPPEQRVVLDAQVFNRTRAFTPMRLLIGKQATEIAELKKTVEQLRGSGPGKPTPGSATTEAPVLDDLEEGKRRGIF